MPVLSFWPARPGFSGRSSYAVNAEVNFPSCAEVKIPTLLDVLGQCETFCLGGRPRRFLGSTGAEMGGSLKFSGTSLACSLSR